MSKLDPLDEYEGLSESQRLQAEYILLDKAFRNSFDIIVGKTTLKFILKETDNIQAVILAHDPESPLDTQRNWDSLQNMMDYFIEEEEYEKCAKIRDIMNLFTENDSTKQEKKSS
jgi:hypothetical protein